MLHSYKLSHREIRRKIRELEEVRARAQNKFNFILRPFYRSLRARTCASTIKVFLFFISTDSVVFSVILEELRGINSPCLEQVYQGLKNGVFRKMGIINSFKILEEVR